MKKIYFLILVLLPIMASAMTSSHEVFIQCGQVAPKEPSFNSFRLVSFDGSNTIYYPEKTEMIEFTSIDSHGETVRDAFIVDDFQKVDNGFILYFRGGGFIEYSKPSSNPSSNPLSFYGSVRFYNPTILNRIKILKQCEFFVNEGATAHN